MTNNHDNCLTGWFAFFVMFLMLVVGFLVGSSFGHSIGYDSGYNSAVADSKAYRVINEFSDGEIKITTYVVETGETIFEKTIKSTGLAFPCSKSMASEYIRSLEFSK